VLAVSNSRAITLVMEAASTFETSLNFYQTTQSHNTEDRHLHTRRRENLISQSQGNSEQPKFEKWLLSCDSENLAV
jgi:hypothetical protein